VGTFLNNLNVSKLIGNVNGGLLAAAGLPENFFVTNPQFGTVYLVGNNANSTYHALQVEFEKRFGHGWVYRAITPGARRWARTNSAPRSITTTPTQPEEPQLRQADHDLQPHTCFQEATEFGTARREEPMLLRGANRIVDGFLGG
jgi:hypothetical protein